MKIDFKKTPEQIELVKAIGSKNEATAREAQEAFAAFIGPIIQTVLQQAGSANLIYSEKEYDEDDSPSLPLDLYYDKTQTDYIQTWSQTMAGGLPTSQVEGISEMKISTYRLDTAVSFLKKYARKSRLDVIAKATERMAQEILIKQERNAWAVLLKALAEATTNSTKHVIRASAQDFFTANDLSRLMTLLRRIHSSWAGGTPTSTESAGITDLFVSPEIKEQIRGFAFNAMNTVGAGGVAIGSNDARNNGIPLPDAIREQIFRGGGTSEIYGVNITDLLELGITRKYNVLFKEFAAGDTAFGGTAGSPAAFASATDELLVGVDLTSEAFIRPVARQADSGGQFTVLPDDQWVSRSDKAGFYGWLEEGRVVIDSRNIVGIVV